MNTRLLLWDVSRKENLSQPWKGIEDQSLFRMTGRCLLQGGERFDDTVVAVVGRGET